MVGAVPVPLFCLRSLSALMALHPGGSRGKVASSPPRCLVTSFAAAACTIPSNSLCLGYQQLCLRHF